MRAIPTEYNSYKFRSRLEARWAVFFDTLTIPYQYEPEGFESVGFRYLPDFHFHNGLWVQESPTPLPNIRVEIKPNLDLAENERHKIAEFLKQSNDYILLIGGDPSHTTPMRLLRHTAEVGWYAPFVRWAVLSNGQVGLLEVGDSADPNPQPPNHIKLAQAFTTARQAYFEYGDTKRQRVCKECRQLFIPYRDHFHTCHNCYTDQKAAVLPVAPVRQPTPLQRPNVVPAYVRVGSGRGRYRPRSAMNRFRLRTTIQFTIAIGLVLFGFANRNNGGPFSSLNPFSILSPATPTAEPFPSTPTPFNATSPPCSCSKNLYSCVDFDTKADAQACYDYCLEPAGDIHWLDADENGLVCESLEK